MSTKARLRLMAGLPLLLGMASCVPPVTDGSRPASALSVASAASAAPGFSFEALPPPSSLGRLAPADQAKWQKAAGLLAPPSATPAAPFALGGDDDGRRRALECLTTAVYHEARSEGPDGQRAVAQVVLNRVRHPAFPASVCGVVYQGSGRRTGCQFSFTCDGSLGRRREPGAWERAREIAAAALQGEVYAAVGNATHYHTRAVLPYWAGSLARSASIGAHIFYRWRGGAGTAGAFRQNYTGYEGVPAARRRAVAPSRVTARAEPPAAVERIETGGETIIVHRGVAAPPAAAAEAFGVRVHVGASPPAAT